MKPELIYELEFLAELTEGPQGRPLFVYTDIERPEKEAPKYRSRLATWDGELKFLTQGEARNPAYKGDWIYFVRKADKTPQLFRMSVHGGEPEQLTTFKAGVQGYKLSPDGSKIALLSQGEYETPKPDAPKVFTDWPHKYDGRGYLQGPKANLYVWEGGAARLLFTPDQPVDEFCWGLQGDGLYVVMSGSARERWDWVQRLYWLGLDSQLSELTGGVGPISGLEPTPDGGLVYLAHAWEHGGGTEARLYVRGFGGEIRELAHGSFGNSVNSDVRIGTGQQGPRLGPDGRVYLVATHKGTARMMAVGLDGHTQLFSPPEFSILGFAFCGGEVYTLAEDYTHGARLTRRGEVLLDPNSEPLGRLPAPQPLHYPAPQGHEVPGLLLLPDGPGPHPTILYVHGGPHTAFGNALMLQLQFFRSAGFAVLYGNPRGSTGYGQEFVKLDSRWGEIDVEDLLGLLDHALAHFPLDASRVAVAGGSYGGYMTNWLTATHPERFKAAVTDRSISNWFSFFGASDIGPRFTRLELGAQPWERPEVLWEKSPLSKVHQVQTPTLVVHSENDHRCPIDQGETWYTMLLHKGVPTKFFRCPEEGHELSRSGRPDRRVERLEAYLEWFQTYL
ncbi:MAG: S9 family peptidase [Meiothermus sp.]|nr:S9 family peptidase [Meiothermus sp.]